RRDHLIPDRGLRRLAARHLQFDRLEQAATPLYLVAFDLLSGAEVRLSDGPLADAVLAAAANSRPIQPRGAAGIPGHQACSLHTSRYARAIVLSNPGG